MGHNHKWTNLDDDLLHREYELGRYSAERLAQKIGVSRSAVVARATRIGLADRRSKRKQVVRQSLPDRCAVRATKHGFDLTAFPNAEAWEKLCCEFNLQLKARFADKPFVWDGDELTVTTCNNPITGEYYRAGQRQLEVGYVSYIGLEGDTELVLSCVKRIRKLANYIKGESVGEREFV